jgi:hypothetical protein
MEAADLLAEDALSHPGWQNAFIRQQSFYPALTKAAPNFSDAIARRVVGVIAAFARPPLDHDFEVAAILLAELYKSRASEREMIRGALFPPDQPLPVHLVRMANRFDVETPREECETYVRQGHELLDVQIEGGRVVIGQDVTSLLVMAACKQHLKQEQIDSIIGKMLDLVENPNNHNNNRSQMIYCTALFIDKASLEKGRRAVRLYAKFAADYRVEGHPLHGAPEEEHPLNAFRLGGMSGWPQDVRGQALIAIGAAVSRPELVEGMDVDGLVHAALEDPNSAVRRDACIAVSRTEVKFRDLLQTVVVRAVDPVSEVASIALQVLACRCRDVASLSLAGTMLAVASTQARHVDLVVRTAAAGVIASLRDLPPSSLTSAEHQQREAISRRLSADIARSVRRKVTKIGG